VKTKTPNDLALYDMSGNVWELCFDRFSVTYNYMHGGAYTLVAEFVQVGYVFNFIATYVGNYDDIGFRFCRSK